jgi:cell division protein FtsW
MKDILKRLKGDKGIWAFIALLALLSFMPVFSASSNLAYKNHGTGNTFAYLLKHLAHILFGLVIIYQVHRIPYHYYRFFSRIFLPLIWLMLLFTLVSGTIVDGANASRWLRIPIVGLTFQPSAFAAIVLYIFVARYLSKPKENPITFKKSFIDLWLPVGITLLLILPANFSTTALIFAMVLMLVFIGNYPLKYIGAIVGIGFIGLLFFVLVAKAFPDAFPNRVDTWISRMESFTTNKPTEDDYQIEKAKIAIASGGIYGLGPGKSIQKNFLPQSSSDFIFAIIVEEYGIFGALAIITIYLLLLFRFIIAARKSNSEFGKLLVVGLGFPIIFQAFINMGVAVELLPVTGQTLPLISSGGTSIWMICAAIGIILNVTKKEEEIAAELSEKQKRQDALEKLIDNQLLDDEQENSKAENEDYSIQDNPMNAILNKN